MSNENSRDSYGQSLCLRRVAVQRRKKNPNPLQLSIKILVSEPELDDTRKFPIRYVGSMWKGINFEPFNFENTGVGPVGKSKDLLGDGSIELINIPGHTSGLTAVKLNHNGKFILLFSDGGYAKKSWQEMIPPGTALDEAQAFKSLQWIRQMSLDENCVESLANHDPDISPHEIILN